MFESFAQFCLLAHGWRRLLLAFCAGALAALSMPPLFVFPAMFVAMPILVWLLDGVETEQSWLKKTFGPAFRIGWAFGFGYFTLSLHWMSGAFFVEPDLFLWALPLALFGLPAVLAIFWGLGASLAHLMWSDFGQRIFALAAALSLTELLRGTFFTGFPWNLPGYALTFSDQTMQLGSLVGVYGMSFVVLLISATPALIWPDMHTNLMQRITPFATALLAIAGVFVFGQLVLQNNPTQFREDVRLRIVQPNVPQVEKWKVENREWIFNRLFALSQEMSSPEDPGLVSTTHLVWPESVFPFLLSEHPDALARLARMLPNGTTLLAGAARENLQLGNQANSGIFNSIIAINDQGEITATYDKYRLVPFGEYVPFKSILAQFGLREIVTAADSFISGEHARRPFQPLGTPALLPLICYEAIFTGALGDTARQSDWMLNLTNDAWFQGTLGPAQHFAHARMRAVEEGLPMVRAANTGISAVIDPRGRVVGALAEGEQAVLNAKLPVRLEKTLFSQYGNGLFYIILIVSFVSILMRNRWRRHWET